MPCLAWFRDSRLGIVRVRDSPCAGESPKSTGSVPERPQAARSGVIVSSSSGDCKKPLARSPLLAGSDAFPLSVIFSSVVSGELAEGNGTAEDVVGGLFRRGSTRDFQGPWKGLPSTNNVCREGRRHSQLGNAFILFLRTLMV